MPKYDYNVLKVELSEEEIEEYIKETRILSQLQGNKATNEKQIEFHAIDLQKKNLKNCLEYPYKSSVLSD